MRYAYTALALCLVALVTMVGCTRTNEPPAPSTPEAKPPAAKATDHGHKKGEHDGIIVEIGRDNYHAEAVFAKDGTLRLYTLGNDEARILEVETQTLEAYIKPETALEATPIPLKAEPRAGDAAGKTSQFVGTVPAALRGQAVSVTVPSIAIAGERFRFSFASTAGHAEPMPATVEGDEGQKLYLTPGGKYTAADIKANGNTTAGAKYANFKATHDLKPKANDRICPITMTRANPQCTWIIGGKTYQFCCPPCIDEFVQLAKDNPEQIKEPGDYIKK